MPEPLDELDRSLRDRIGAAEARVRVSSAPPDGRASAPGSARWLRPPLLLATATVAVVLAVLVIGRLPDRTVGDATPSPSTGDGVSASARNGDFVLTLSSPRSTWTTEDAVEITATLSYDGDEPEVEVGGGGGPVVFSLVQLEGGNAVLGGGQDLPCLRYPLGPDEPLVWPFQKTGGINHEPPFDRDFFDDPDLHLPPGRWEVRAVLEYGDPECGNIQELIVSLSLAVIEAEGSPGPSAVATEPPVSSAPPSREATAGTDLEWAETGAFSAAGPAMVRQIVARGSGLVAIGIAYDRDLPNLGPLPAHAAQVWVSDDGRSWSPVGLGANFRNADLGRIVLRADGSLLALGSRYDVTASDPHPSPQAAAWESVDGRTWTPVANPLPGLVGDAVQGARGSLAFIRSPSPTSEGETLWHSADGRTWNQVHSLVSDEYIRAIGAGPDGFVVSGQRVVGGSDEDEPIVWASGDGRRWFKAASPPTDTFMVLAPLGEDWVAVRGAPPITGETWFSANGLDWSSLGRAHLEEIPLAGGVTCREYPHYLAAAGRWLVMGTTLSYGCSEGGFVVHGTPQISLDGATWTRLPFEAGIPGETRSGSAVNASATLDGNLILAGEHNGVATFWIGEPR